MRTLPRAACLAACAATLALHGCRSEPARAPRPPPAEATPLPVPVEAPPASAGRARWSDGLPATLVEAASPPVESAPASAELAQPEAAPQAAEGPGSPPRAAPAAGPGVEEPVGTPVGLVAAARRAELHLRWAPAPGGQAAVAFEVLRGEEVVASPREPRAVLRGLQVAVVHCFAVRAVAAGRRRSSPSGAACATLPDLTPPSAPGDLSVRPLSETRVALRWSPSADDVGVAGYEISREGEGAVPAASTMAEVDGLSAGRLHCFQVLAMDAAGNRSPPAGPACTTTPDLTPPAAPGSLTASGEPEGRVLLRWTAASDNVGVSGYDVWRGGERLGMLGEATEWTDTTARPGETCWTVRARDRAGNVSPPTPPSCLRVPDVHPPTVPAEVHVAARSSSEAVMAWSPSTDDVAVAGYEVLRNGEIVASTPTPRARQPGLAAQTEYCYAVRAFDAAGNRSAASEPACARTADPGQPVAPAALSVERQDADEILLRWEPSPEVGVSYVVTWDGGRRTPGVPRLDTSVGTTPLTRFKLFGPQVRARRCYRVKAVTKDARESPASLPLCTGTAALGTR